MGCHDFQCKKLKPTSLLPLWEKLTDSNEDTNHALMTNRPHDHLSMFNIKKPIDGMQASS